MPPTTALQSQTSGWEIAAAVATVAAVVVALAIALLPTIWRWRNRPRLVLLVGEEEPHVRTTHMIRGDNDIYLRLEVKNDGRSEVVGVRGTITHFWARANDKDYEWIEHDIDPLEMKWVSQAPDTQPPHVSIAAHQSDYLDLAQFDASRAQLKLVPNSRRGRSFYMESTYPLVEHRVQVVVAASNAVPVTVVVGFLASQSNYFEHVEVTSPPPAERVMRTGLLNILRRSSERAAQADADNENQA